MTLLVISRGLPGCGKSTDAKAWVAKDPATRARVNRDDLRKMLHGAYGDHVTERQVTLMAHGGIIALLASGISVYCDDTNLNDAQVDTLCRIAREAGAQVEIRDMRHMPLAQVIAQDAQREGTEHLGEKKIRAMHAKYIEPLGQAAAEAAEAESTADTPGQTDEPGELCAYCVAFTVGSPATEHLVCGCAKPCGAERCNAKAYAEAECWLCGSPMWQDRFGRWHHKRGPKDHFARTDPGVPQAAPIR